MDNLRRWPIIRELGAERGNFFNKDWCVTGFDSLLFLNFPRVNTVWDFFYLCPLPCTIFSCRIRLQTLYTSITAIRLEDVRHVPTWERNRRQWIMTWIWKETLVFISTFESCAKFVSLGVHVLWCAQCFLSPDPPQKRGSFHLAFSPRIHKKMQFPWPSHHVLPLLYLVNMTVLFDGNRLPGGRRTAWTDIAVLGSSHSWETWLQTCCCWLSKQVEGK